MIRYALKCNQDHSFESWFQSGGAFDALNAAGHVQCPLCGSADVKKAIMAPRVRPARSAAVAPPAPAAPEAETIGTAPQAPDAARADTDPDQHAKAPTQPALTPAAQGAGALSAPGGEIEAALQELRRKVEKNSEYVGKGFASEARAMHLGEAPERAIFGEARVEEARELIEDGIAVVPLPFLPGRKSN
ncbi:DUF1178 family protein [Candidatus Halocynthiibacter alkanivorans]|uniref:DUF1178 family protein n=1 Tax=Candidatus Halocynthiibacter alkanivorans TaxID=2267619 RepID=UPI000DF2D963|nr:DUF1178 family protein [Candidatus Halocynthiibacter alkanivorans]